MRRQLQVCDCCFALSSSFWLSLDVEEVQHLYTIRENLPALGSCLWMHRTSVEQSNIAICCGILERADWGCCILAEYEGTRQALPREDSMSNPLFDTYPRRSSSDDASSWIAPQVCLVHPESSCTIPDSLLWAGPIVDGSNAEAWIK